MRTSFQLVIIAISLLTLEFVLGGLHLERRFSPRLVADIGGIAICLSCLLVPGLFVFFPPTHGPDRRLLLRLFTSVFVSWYLQLIFRMTLERRGLMALDWRHDGIGMNAAMFVFGWIPPLVVTMIYILVLNAWIRRREQRADSKAGKRDVTPQPVQSPSSDA